jgi:integral membrane protein
VQGALKRYRIVANVVGVLLVLLTVGMFLKYLPPHDPTMVSVVGTIHGGFYMVYVLMSYDVWRRTGWPLIKMFDMVLAGIVPFRTFFVERKIARQVQELVPA